MPEATVHLKIEFAGQECDICREEGYVFAVFNLDTKYEKQVCKSCVHEKTGIDIEDEIMKGK